MDISKTLEKAPSWFITLSLIILTIVIIETLYFSKRPIHLFGQLFGPLDENKKTIVIREDSKEVRTEIKKLQTSIQSLSKKVEKLSAFKSSKITGHASSKNSKNYDSEIKKLEAGIEKLAVEYRKISKLVRGENKRNNLQKIAFIKKKGSFVKELSGIQVELTKCISVGSGINCKFKLTSLKKDREVILDPDDSRIITAAGDEFKGAKAVLGTKKSVWSAYNTLVRGVAMNASISFEQVSDVTNAPLIEVDLNDVKLQYRNVPISI